MACIAGNSNCKGAGHKSSEECPKCKLKFYRCDFCGGIIPGSKACLCGQEELMMEQMRENMKNIPKPKFPNSERF